MRTSTSRPVNRLGDRLAGLFTAGVLLLGLAGCGRSPATQTHPVFIDLEILARRHPGWPTESPIDREEYHLPVPQQAPAPQLPRALEPTAPSATLAPPSAAVAGLAGGSRYERTKALLSARDDRKIREMRAIAEATFKADLNRHAAETAIKLDQAVAQARTDAAAEITRLRLLVLSSEQQSRSLAGGPPADVTAKLDKARADLSKAEGALKVTVTGLRDESGVRETQYAAGQRAAMIAELSTRTEAVRAATARALADLAASATSQAEELPPLEEPSAEKVMARLGSGRRIPSHRARSPVGLLSAPLDQARLAAYAADLRIAIRAEVRMRIDRMAHERRMQVTYVKRPGVPDETAAFGHALSLELGQ